MTARVTGPRLLALIGTLTGGYRLSKRLTQGLLSGLFGIGLSVGAISQAEVELSAALAPIVHEAHTHVRQAAVVHVDETGHKERGMWQWMWLVVAGTVSVFLAHASRSAQAARDALGAGFAGFLVPDRYGAYAWADAQRRQLCWAHLVRDFTKMAERTMRSYVIWRKVGFGAQSARGSRYLARIMTVAGSCRLQGRNLLGFLTQAVQAHWGCASLPSLVRLDAVAG